MIQLGKTQCLNIIKKTDFGVYLGTEDDKVLLPKKQVPEDIEIGDALTVFVYRDSSDRLIATTNTPKIELGGLARLKVSEVHFLTGDLRRIYCFLTGNRQHTLIRVMNTL